MRFSTVYFASLLGVAITALTASAGSSLCTTTSQCDTLDDLFNDMKSKMPSSDSGQYVHPSPQTLLDMETIVDEMMNGSCENIDLLSLSSSYSVGIFTDAENGQDYCVLITNSIDYSLGNVVVNQDTYKVKDLSIDSPHPRYDTHTGKQAMAVFKMTNARSFVVSGSHRNADLHMTSCQGDGYLIADAAHTINGFHAAVKAILSYYENLERDYTAIQFHGMGSSACSGVDAYFSHGTGTIAPQANEKIDLIRNQMSALTSGTFNVPGDSPYCKLSGGSNLQGRLINNVSQENVCTASAHGYSGRFIHLETKYWLRQPNMYPTWAAAINNAYDNMNWAAPPRGITLTYPNGGEEIEQGSQVEITWTSEALNPTDELHLSVGLWVADEYIYEKGIVWKAPWATNSGSYTWTVPSSLDEGDYVIRVRKQDETGVVDYSDATFRVVAPLPRGITVEYPNGGEVVGQGTMIPIVWSSYGLEETDELHISVGEMGGSSYVYKQGIVWKAPWAQNSAQVQDWRVRTSLPEGQYVICIRKQDETSIQDYSDAVFQVVKPFSLTFPNGPNETLQRGETYTILWDIHAVGVDTVKLSLHEGSSYSWSTLIQNEVPNTGTFEWTVPTSVAPGSDYFIRIRNVDYTPSKDYSDFAFTIE